MQDIQIFVQLSISIISFLVVTLIPSITLLIKKWKALRVAKTELEKQKVLQELNDTVCGLVQEAETAYKQVDQILKSQGGSGSGSVKKDSVMTKLQAHCIKKGIEFDSNYWSNKIDEIVTMTRKVNA